MPADVAARFESVIAGLSDARAGVPSTTPLDTDESEHAPGGSTSGPEGLAGSALSAVSVVPEESDAEVVPLRRKAAADPQPTRKWPAYLLSAAAVVAIGFGVTQMIPDDSSPGSNASDDSAAHSEGLADSDAGEPLNAAPEKDAPTDLTNRAPGAQPALPDIPGLSPLRTPASGAEAFASREAAACAPADIPDDSDLRVADYRGKEAVVVYLPPSETGRLVEVYTCVPRSEEPVASITLPAGE